MIQKEYIGIAQGINSFDIELMFDKLFEAYLPKIRKLIKDRWLLGKTPEGSFIGFYKSSSYERYKYFEKNDKAGYGKVDLTLTGNLGDAIQIAFIDAGEYEIFSTDYKYEDIVEYYGDWNFNITDAEKEQIVQEITKKIVNEILKTAYYG